jgi:hypothetical protein
VPGYALRWFREHKPTNRDAGRSPFLASDPRCHYRQESHSPGITATAVARQLGASRSWASREANAPGTRILIAEELNSQLERLSALFDQTLGIIKDAFQASKIFVVRGTPLRLSCFPNAGSRHMSLGHRGQHSRH